MPFLEQGPAGETRLFGVPPPLSGTNITLWEGQILVLLTKIESDSETTVFAGALILSNTVLCITFGHS